LPQERNLSPLSDKGLGLKATRPTPSSLKDDRPLFAKSEQKFL